MSDPREQRVVSPDEAHGPKSNRIVITEEEVNGLPKRAETAGRSPSSTLSLPPVAPHFKAESEPYPIVSDLKERELPTYRHYKPIKRLGQGGMGMVLQARDTVLQRDVAVKVPLGNCEANSPTRRRFQREAEIAARFHHPNFCPIYELGEILGKPCLVMAYLDGETLAARLKREGPPPERQATEMIRTLARALAAAHAQSIYHRDLKPDNIMATTTGELVIMDFGLARYDSASDPSLTEPGTIFGTPHYMSPEQARGENRADWHHSDIYSLGVIFFELLCGKRPFTGTTDEIIGQVLNDEPPPSPARHLPALNPLLVSICQTAMAKWIEARYPTMDAFAAALDLYLNPPPQADDEASPQVPLRPRESDPGDNDLYLPVREGAANHRPPTGAAAESKSRATLRIGILRSGDATYVNEIQSAFLTRLTAELASSAYRLTPSDDVVEWEPDAIPNWSLAVERLMTRGKREAFQYLVAIGTQAALALRETLGNDFGAVPTLFLGVTYPRLSALVDSESARIESRKVTGIRYGCGLDAVASLLHHRLFPGRQLCFVYQKGVPQDEMSFRDLQTTRLAKEGILQFIELQRRLRAEDLADDSLVYFSWYTFTRFFHDREFGILSNKLAISIMQDNVRDGIAVAGVGTDHDWIGHRGAQRVLEHLNARPGKKPDWGTLDIEPSPLVYWLNLELARARGIEFSNTALAHAQTVYG